MLSQLRGFGLHTFLSCQYLSQMDAQVQTVINNTGLKIISTSNHEDVKKMISDHGESVSVPYEYFIKQRGKETLRFISRSPKSNIKEDGDILHTKIKRQLELYYRKRSSKKGKPHVTPSHPRPEPNKPRYTLDIPDDIKK